MTIWMESPHLHNRFLYVRKATVCKNMYNSGLLPGVLFHMDINKQILPLGVHNVQETPPEDLPEDLPKDHPRTDTSIDLPTFI